MQKIGQSVREQPPAVSEVPAAITIRLLLPGAKSVIQGEGYRVDNQSGKMLVTATDPVGAMYGTMFGGKAYKDALRFSWTKYLPQVERDLKLVEGAGLSSKK